MKFIVFGLGNFGAALSEQLVQLGHEVIGVDHKLEAADRYKHSISHVISLDSTSKEAMSQLPLNDIDAAIVGIGEDEGAAIMTTALLKQLNVSRIICRVTSPLQKIVLEAMNINEFIHPEGSSAERLALKLDMPGVIDSFQISTEYRLLEVEVPARYVGSTIASLQLAETYSLVLVSIMRAVDKKSIFGSATSQLKVMGIVSPDTVLRFKDVLILFGSPVNLDTFIEGK